MSVRELLLVGAGGAVGSALRHVVSNAAQRLQAPPTVAGPAIIAVLPVGTLVVNVTGSLLIGLAAGLAESRSLLSADARLLLVTGVLGGYTTFSALSLETLLLMRGGQITAALTSVVLQIVLGIATALAGFTAGMAAGRSV